MKNVYLLVLGCIVSLSVFSQTDIAIGTGTVGNSNTGYPCPLQDYYEGSRAQYLYRASELSAAGMAAGVITAIKFEVTNLNGFLGTAEQLRISMGQTTIPSLGTTTWETVPFQIYGLADDTVILGTNTFIFSSPFFWDGVSNIVVDICNGDPNNATGVTYTGNPSIPWTTGLSFNGSHSFRSDNLGNLCGTGSTTNSGLQTTRPNIIFTWKDSIGNNNPNSNTLYASAFFDRNLNGVRDANEPWDYNAKFIVTKPGVDTITAYSSGVALIAIDTGTYYSTVQASMLYFSTQLHTTVNTSYSNIDTALFALQTIPGIRDGTVTITPLNRARPGFPLPLLIHYSNKGTDTITNGTIELIKSAKLTFDSASPAPSFTSGDTLRWIVNNLQPVQAGSIHVYCHVKPVPVVNIGDTIRNVASFTFAKADSTIKDNYSSCTQFARVSSDPNDKSENHGGKISLAEVMAADYLTYTIRFQNTGNDTALNVYIRDTLDNKLDWSTMEMLTSSANYQMTLNDGKCVWSFNNINLVDSNANEPASHGYLVYRIKPKPTLQVGDVINNRASIYFDFNPPVATNVEKTIVVANVLPVKLLSFTAMLSEQLAAGSPDSYREQVNLRWTTENEINADRFEVQRSVDGREFSKIGVQSAAGSGHYQYNDLSLPTANRRLYYRLKMIDKDGSFTYSQTREVSFSMLHVAFSIYPNPAKDKLQVQVTSEKKIALQMQVMMQDGKVILSKQWKAQEGVSTQVLNVSALQSGSYFLKLTSEGKEQSVVKFEKL